MHGSFILPLVLAGSALVFGKGRRKSMLIAFGVMLIATLLSPHGFGFGNIYHHAQLPSINSSHLNGNRRVKASR
jgi:hypothetical protein